MLRPKMFRGALLTGALGLVPLLGACGDNAKVIMPEVSNDLFRNYVALGNSITAGWQSDGINDSTQAQSYAVLVAGQMHTRFVFPALAKPGCRPPIASFVTQARVMAPGQTAPSTDLTCAYRSPSSLSGVINNVAVPGIASIDPTQVVETNGSGLTMLFLGGKSMVQKALEAEPTFATVWVGNNDILAYAINGTPSYATAQADFQTRYSAMMSELLQGAPQLKGVLIGVVQVASAPILFTSEALKNPFFLGGLQAFTGKAITPDPNCAINTALISFRLIPEIAAGRQPTTIPCAKTANPAYGDQYVLDAAEQTQTAGIINGYNTYIKAMADSIGWAYYDPNTTLARLAATDPVLASHVPDLAHTNAPFGQYVTLDGVHPSAATHIQIANDLIDVINTKYKTNLEKAPTS